MRTAPRRCSIIVKLLMLVPASHAAAEVALPAPPATPQRPVTDTLHGTDITDPYGWLEGNA